MTAPAALRPVYDLNAVRRQFAVTRQGVAFLNHAGMSPLPEPVREAMQRAIDEMAEGGSRAYKTVMEPLLASLPGRIAALVNAHPDEVAFVENTSTGLNLIAHSLPLQPGDNVLVCGIEFPANVYPWMSLARARGVETRLVEAVNGGLSLEKLEAARDASSRVVAVSAVQFFSGRREDLAALGRYCADHGLWLIVDAIQAAGIVPIDMQAMGIHALAAGGQKALCAPPGQGFMVIRRDLIEQMTPVFVGAVSVQGWEHWLRYDMTPGPGARRFDMGTFNIAGLAGLDAAIAFLMELGIEHIAGWVTHLSSQAIADFSARGWRVITPAAPAEHAHIVTLAWDGDVMAAVATLEAHGIIVREHLDTTGNPYLRLSMHCYNTEEEVFRVGTTLEGLAHEQH